MTQHQVIDSHAHFWDRDRFDYEWLREAGTLSRNFVPSQLFANPAIEAAVFVQADCRVDQALDEARWVSSLATDHGQPILAIVGHAPLERGLDVANDLAMLADVPLVAGVRRLLQSEAPGFALDPGFVVGVRLLARHDLTMDLCIRDWQLGEATALVERCGDVRFVLDHLGKPTVTEAAFGAWADDLAALAAHPNVQCKLSGLLTEAPAELRSASHLLPLVRHAIEVFGPERCMFGSDWPVLTTVADYDDWLAIVLQAVDHLADDDIEKVLRGTALATYRAS